MPIEHWSDAELSALPQRDGFRQRGMEMNRLETFTDAAFAFAVTLLVIGGGDSIPANFDEMIAAIRQIPAFAASFANIVLFWYAHHIWSRRFGLEDGPSLLLSLFLIFVVLVFVYPLKAVYSGAIEFFSGGYFASYFTISSAEDLRNMFLIFGIGYAVLSTVIVLLNRHALAIKDQLALSELEIYDTVTDLRHWAINIVVPVISVVMTLSLPDRLIVFAGVFYCIFAVALPANGYQRDRNRGKKFGAQS